MPECTSLNLLQSKSAGAAGIRTLMSTWQRALALLCYPTKCALRVQEGRAQRELSTAPHIAGQSSQGCLELPLPAWRTQSICFLQEKSCFACLPLAGCRADTGLDAGKVFSRKDNFAKGSPAMKSIPALYPSRHSFTPEDPQWDLGLTWMDSCLPKLSFICSSTEYSL